MFLLNTWYKPMNYSDQAMGDAKAKEQTFKNFFGTVKALARTNWVDREVGWTEEDRQLYPKVAQMQQTVHASLCNNFDTAGATMSMIEMINEMNKYISQNKRPAIYLLKKVAMYITRILRIFGVADGSDDIGWSAGGEEGGNVETKMAPFVDAVVGLRQEIRATAKRKEILPSELMALSDRIRDNILVDLGVSCTDQADGSAHWRLEDPNTLRREQEGKKKLEQEAAQKKLTNAITRQEAVVAKLRETAAPLEDMFKSPEYSAYDAQGMPTVQADGKPVSAASVKKLQKLREKRQQAYEAQLKTADGDMESLIAKEEAKLADLRRQVA
jgi:cysteinyl-tRNA synthetase